MIDNRHNPTTTTVHVPTQHLFFPSFAGSTEMLGGDENAKRNAAANALLTMTSAIVMGTLFLASSPALSNKTEPSYHLAEKAGFASSPASLTSVRTTQSMVAQLKDRGMPIAAIAEVVRVERKTVYSWLDTGIEATRGNSFVRLATLENIFASAQTGSLRFYCRFWERKLSGGQTLKEILTASDINEDAAHLAVTELQPAVQRAIANDAKRKARATLQSPAAHLTIGLEAGSWS